MKNTTIIAVPKGRILEELTPLFQRLNLKPEASFFDENSRALQFKTNEKNISLIRVRPFDVPTFVAFGAAQIGVAGSDVLEEFNYPDLYAPLDLRLGFCRLSIAALAKHAHDDFVKMSHIRVATKYPKITNGYFAKYGIQAECIKLNGAMELAPVLNLCRHIVDLVSSGKTLKENGLVEIEKIMDVSSRLILNRTAFKTRSGEMQEWVQRFQSAVV